MKSAYKKVLAGISLATAVYIGASSISSLNKTNLGKEAINSTTPKLEQIMNEQPELPLMIDSNPNNNVESTINSHSNQKEVNFDGNFTEYIQFKGLQYQDLNDLSFEGISDLATNYIFDKQCKGSLNDYKQGKKECKKEFYDYEFQEALEETILNVLSYKNYYYPCNIVSKNELEFNSLLYLLSLLGRKGIKKDLHLDYAINTINCYKEEYSKNEESKETKERGIPRIQDIIFNITPQNEDELKEYKRKLVPHLQDLYNVVCYGSQKEEKSQEDYNWLFSALKMYSCN